MIARALMRIAALAILAVPGVLAACAGTQEVETLSRNEELTAQIGTDLEATGEYARVDAAYANDALQDADLVVEIGCTSCDPTGVANSVMRAVWQSRINPLRTLSVVVDNVKSDPRRERLKVDPSRTETN